MRLSPVLALPVAALAGLSACEQETYAPSPSAPAPMMMEAEADSITVSAGRMKASPSEAPAEPTVTAYLAYSYDVDLELPHAAVGPTLKGHIARCEAMGPATCVVTGSDITTWDEYSSSASLSMRIAPDDVADFLAEVTAETTEQGGRVVSQRQNVDDLTRSIIDTDARLKAQITLRDRLQTLLETRDGELADLIQIERELARVQGDIDSLTSTLKAMRARVDMSSVDISYQSKVQVVSKPMQPLKSAFGSFFANLAAALASVVTFIAHAVPWTLAGLLLIGLIRLIWPLLGIRFRRKG